MEKVIFSISPFPAGHKYYVFVMVEDDNIAWLAEETTGRGLLKLFGRASIKKARDKAGNFISAPANWPSLTLSGKVNSLGPA